MRIDRACIDIAPACLRACTPGLLLLAAIPRLDAAAVSQHTFASARRTDGGRTWRGGELCSRGGGGGGRTTTTATRPRTGGRTLAPRRPRALRCCVPRRAAAAPRVGTDGRVSARVPRRPCAASSRFRPSCRSGVCAALRSRATAPPAPMQPGVSVVAHISIYLQICVSGPPPLAFRFVSSRFVSSDRSTALAGDAPPAEHGLSIRRRNHRGARMSRPDIAAKSKHQLAAHTHTHTPLSINQSIERRSIAHQSPVRSVATRR